MRRVYLGEYLNFIESAFFKFGIFFKFLHIDDFDCNFFFVSGIDAPVHFAIFSFTYLLMEGVVFDYLNHSVNFIIILINFMGRNKISNSTTKEEQIKSIYVI